MKETKKKNEIQSQHEIENLQNFTMSRKDA